MQDKFDKLSEAFAEEEFTVTDILKVLCAFTSRMMNETGAGFADITEVIHGQGIKFKIHIRGDYEPGK